MKNKKEIKKLSLNKETVTVLSNEQLKSLVGGSEIIIITTKGLTKSTGQINGVIPGQTV